MSSEEIEAVVRYFERLSPSSAGGSADEVAGRHEDR